ncbi:hypothetical protein ACE7GA_06660 [Roseomonas sp. CCTCC AB2023176]|uniref:hypothetical protein n=1 Tax=Roseomonas sp. CCTCC AB2023176 TaxID=3342640 RepID=UPI0035DC4765
MAGCDEASRTRAAADAAWSEMMRRGVAPTPQNYAGWFARCLSGNVGPAVPGTGMTAAAGPEPAGKPASAPLR